MSNRFPTLFKTRTSTEQVCPVPPAEVGNRMPKSGHFCLVRGLILQGSVRENDMRKYLASLAFALCFTASTPAFAATASTDDANASPAVAVQQVRMPFPGLREEAAMVLVGTALIGIAA